MSTCWMAACLHERTSSDLQQQTRSARCCTVAVSEKAVEPIAYCTVSDKELCSVTAIHTHGTHSRVDCLEFKRMQVALQCRMQHYTLSLSIGYWHVCAHTHTQAQTEEAMKQWQKQA